MNSPKFVHNNTNLDLVNINVNAIFGQNPFIYTRDIERKWNSEVIQGSSLYTELTKIVA